MSTVRMSTAVRSASARRRGKGEGSIYRRSDGRWGATITLLDGRRRTVYARTRTDVQVRLRDLIERRDHGLLSVGAEQKLGDYLKAWLEDVARPSIRPRTYEIYTVNLRRFQPLIGHIKLGNLTPAHVQAAYAELLRIGLSARSVNHSHRVLHRALKQAVLWNLIPRNPTDAVSSPRPVRVEMKTLTHDEVQQLFASSEGDRLHALWVVMATTGLRVGEATGFRWDDLDASAGRLTVRRALQRQRDRGLVFVEPKTARSRRTLQLAPIAVSALEDHRRRQAEERLVAGPDWEDWRLTFATETGRPISGSHVYDRFQRALAKAGVQRVRLHDLRHTAASLLLARGVHPKVVQEMLGHSTIQLTLDTYSPVTPGLHAAAAAEMEALFGQ